MGFESWPKKAPTSQSSVDDYADNEELFTLLRRLPNELRARHLMQIESMDDDEAAAYLREVHEKRAAATTEAVVNALEEGAAQDVREAA